MGDSGLSLGALSEYSLGENYELYKDGTALTVTQKSSDAAAPSVSVPMKIFYEDSELQVYNTNYIMQLYSTDSGRTCTRTSLSRVWSREKNPTTTSLAGPRYPTPAR